MSLEEGFSWDGLIVICGKLEEIFFILLKILFIGMDGDGFWVSLVIGI